MLLCRLILRCRCRSSGSLAGKRGAQRPWVKRLSSSLPTGPSLRSPRATKATQVGQSAKQGSCVILGSESVCMMPVVACKVVVGCTHVAHLPRSHGHAGSADQLTQAAVHLLPEAEGKLATQLQLLTSTPPQERPALVARMRQELRDLATSELHLCPRIAAVNRDVAQPHTCCTSTETGVTDTCGRSSHYFICQV